MLGLHRADAALRALINDPDRLDSERDARFDQSPPPYQERESLPSTLPPDSPPEEDEQHERLSDWFMRILRGWGASMPTNQFRHEVQAERRKLMEPGDDTHIHWNTANVARETVKARWQAWGIWEPRWEVEPHGHWRHQTPLSPEPLTDLDTDDEDHEDVYYREDARSNLFGIKKMPSRVRTGYEQEEAELRQRARMAERRYEHDRTRPLHVFFCHVAYEGERLFDSEQQPEQEPPEQEQEQAGRPDDTRVAVDIHTAAYQRVKAQWSERGIWNDQWGVLPGMTWKHEASLQSVVSDEMGDANMAQLSRVLFDSMMECEPNRPPPQTSRGRRRRRRRRVVVEEKEVVEQKPLVFIPDERFPNIFGPRFAAPPPAVQATEDTEDPEDADDADDADDEIGEPMTAAGKRTSRIAGRQARTQASRRANGQMAEVPTADEQTADDVAAGPADTGPRATALRRRSSRIREKGPAAAAVMTDIPGTRKRKRDVADSVPPGETATKKVAAGGKKEQKGNKGNKGKKGRKGRKGGK
ncbi:uncharacterized protein SPSK_09095 [Sporothrix schenckii 1099-18]|uniref:Uncharacterized protein n=2 Tax=Sporothrix schenckii TaxID=29908 RepID=U7Q047_SPOS1|nr:uncharacterized protein SPSK_09095 [Sporothrix schenckii 1099-18]ERT00365.1 hypothetical protein HMPREF1624_03736 [Sporothrix schenckii ATCC 58251]KJR85155.1 hypothetical protein SPSK_09095 [Sporothrix schenckii 1099-18]